MMSPTDNVVVPTCEPLVVVSSCWGVELVVLTKDAEVVVPDAWSDVETEVAEVASIEEVTDHVVGVEVV